MIIDPIASIPPSNAAEPKEKKRIDTEDLRPIEESGDSTSLELDFKEEDVATRQTSKETISFEVPVGKVPFIQNRCLTTEQQ